MIRGQLEVAAPELQTLSLHVSWDVRIAAPKLTELSWFKFRYDHANGLRRQDAILGGYGS